MASNVHRVAFFADIHYRFDRTAKYWTPPKELDVDAILLGGDNHCSPQDLHGLLQAIRKSQRDETPIVVIPGNGEYVDQELNESRRQYKEMVKSLENVAFLDDEVLKLNTGLRIIGSTLWSYVSQDEMPVYNAKLAQRGSGGVDDITLGDRPLTYDDTNELFQKSRSFIERELRALSKDERKNTVVCTHFWPTLDWLTPAQEQHWKWRETIGSDLDDLIREVGPKVWLCGHLHETQRVTIGDTQVLSNPRVGNSRGTYNPGFDDTYVVEFLKQA